MSGSYGFLSLQVNFPIAVNALGVYDFGSDGLQSNLTVTLYDTTTQVYYSLQTCD